MSTKYPVSGCSERHFVHGHVPAATILPKPIISSPFAAAVAEGSEPVIKLSTPGLSGKYCSLRAEPPRIIEVPPASRCVFQSPGSRADDRNIPTCTPRVLERTDCFSKPVSPFLLPLPFSFSPTDPIGRFDQFSLPSVGVVLPVPPTAFSDSPSVNGSVQSARWNHPDGCRGSLPFAV